MRDRHFSLQWHITNRCDQRCRHCYIYSASNSNDSISELGINELEKILENYDLMIKRIGMRGCIALTGGDPLLYPYFWELLELIKEKKIQMQILGNPFHINEVVAKRLYDSGCSMYQMSIDGLRDTHDMIRKKGSFDETLRAIDILNAAGIKTTIMTTVSSMNINEVPQIVDVIKDKVYAFSFARYCPNDGDVDGMVSAEEYHNFLGHMWEKYNECKESCTRFILKDHLWKLFLYEQGLLEVDNKLNNVCIMDGCHCGIAHMTILDDGQIYACRRCESPIGSALNDSLYDVFFGVKMDEYRNFEKFSKCSKCDLIGICRGCPAVSKCSTGDFYGNDPQCWKII